MVQKFKIVIFCVLLNT